MILLAVVVGYLLGVAPSIYKEIKEIINKREEKSNAEKDGIKTQELLDEWLNGPKKPEEPAKPETTENNNVGINQADIYTEYITGKESNKEG